MNNLLTPDSDKRINVWERVRANEALLTADYVRSILDYSPMSGLFTWQIRNDVPARWNVQFAGRRAGFLCKDGYRRIRINNQRYTEHRIAYFWMLGYWPEHELDHKEAGKEARSDNRWQNLRPATLSQNAANRSTQSNNRLGIKGVCRLNHGFKAQLKHAGKNRHLGMFPTAELASVAYARAAHETFGEYARAV